MKTKVITKNATPKKPRTAYISFSGEYTKNLRKSNPELSLPECAQRAGKVWSKLSNQDKVEYYQMAQQDKERYINQKNEVKK